jgi:hypothetical protein
MNNEIRNFAIKIARENPQIKSPNELKLREKFIKKGAIDEGDYKNFWYLCARSNRR